MEWRITGGDKTCSLSGKVFKIGDAYYSLLLRKDGDYSRKDISPERWEEVDKKDPDIFSWWKTKVPNPDKPKAQSMDFQAILSFFLRLMDLEEPEQKDLQLRYLLGLLLLRKKLLKFVRSLQREGAEHWVLRLADGEIEYMVLKPNLSDLQMSELSRQIGSIFEMENLD